MNKYYRVTAYHRKNNISAVFDSYGKFEKLYEFSAFLVSKGFDIIAVSKYDKFKDGDFPKVSYDENHIYLRAAQRGKAEKVNGKVQIQSLSYPVAM